MFLGFTVWSAWLLCVFRCVEKRYVSVHYRSRHLKPPVHKITRKPRRHGDGYIIINKWKLANIAGWEEGEIAIHEEDWNGLARGDAEKRNISFWSHKPAFNILRSLFKSNSIEAGSKELKSALKSRTQFSLSNVSRQGPPEPFCGFCRFSMVSLQL